MPARKSLGGQIKCRRRQAQDGRPSLTSESSHATADVRSIENRNVLSKHFRPESNVGNAIIIKVSKCKTTLLDQLRLSPHSMHRAMDHRRMGALTAGNRSEA